MHLIAAFLLLVSGAIAAPLSRPNIVILLSDDHGWANLGFINPAMHTPNMMDLVSEGINISHHYAFQFCSPTRSSLMTGRLPLHVNQHNSAEWPWTASPVDTRMRMISEVLQKEAGYYTSHVGKWHLGLSSKRYTPHGRGYNSSIGYLSGSEDHFDQRRGCEKCPAGSRAGVDLYSAGPALGLNGTWATQLYTRHAVQSIQTAAAASQPLFMYVAFQNTHEPLQVPKEYEDLYPASQIPIRRTYNGMASAVDSAMGNITQTLKQMGMWNNTLVLMSSDNGGPSLVGGVSAANNYPLRGGKGNDFEGGTRVGAFVSGGLVPPHMRGTQAEGYIHICDWWLTFCKLAGVESCSDDAEGVPGLDSLDMWPMLSGANLTSPRTEVPLHLGLFPNGTIEAGALISGDLKVVYGRQGGTGFWWGPEYPNSTTKVPANNPGCPTGCLFNIRDDPTEHVDLSQSQPEAKAALLAKLLSYRDTLFQSDANGTNDGAGCAAAMVDGFFVPWLP